MYSNESCMFYKCAQCSYQVMICIQMCVCALTYHCRQDLQNMDCLLLYVTWTKGMSRMSEILYLRYWQKQWSNSLVSYCFIIDKFYISNFVTRYSILMGLASKWSILQFGDSSVINEEFIYFQQVTHFSWPCHILHVLYSFEHAYCTNQWTTLLGKNLYVYTLFIQLTWWSVYIHAIKVKWLTCA